MRHKRKIITILIILFLLGSLNFTLKITNQSISNLLSYANSFINKKTKDLEKITGTGNLVKDRNNLKDSKITGKDYINNDLYYPYYTVIEDNEKQIYQQIYQNIISYQTTFIPVVSVDKANLENAITAVYNDHPEIFWTDLEYSYKYLQDGEVVQVTLTFNKTYKNIESSKQSFLSSANKIIQEANKKTTNYEKEKYVHDVLIQMIAYDKSADLNQSAYSAIVYNLSVCAGYSKAFQYIMIQLGIPTYYVAGSSGEDHAWNIVKLEDGYYNVDVTWDDSRGTSYNYFNIPDSEFSKTHTRLDLSRYLPACNSYQYKGIKQYNKKIPIVEKKEYPKEKVIEEEPINPTIIMPSSEPIESVEIENQEEKEANEGEKETSEEKIDLEDENSYT